MRVSVSALLSTHLKRYSSLQYAWFFLPDFPKTICFEGTKRESEKSCGKKFEIH